MQQSRLTLHARAGQHMHGQVHHAAECAAALLLGHMLKQVVMLLLLLPPTTTPQPLRPWCLQVDGCYIRQLLAPPRHQVPRTQRRLTRLPQGC